MSIFQNNKLADLLREPILHFVFAAACLFLLDNYLGSSQHPQIIISHETINYLIQQQEELQLRKLSDVEKSALVKDYIDDEILYAEAYRHGLDRGDARMRRNMISKMHNLLGADVPEPSAEELRQWFDDDPLRFATSERWSIRLRVGEGDVQNLYSLSQQELVLALGPNAAQAIQDAVTNTWFGPVDTIQGPRRFQVTEYFPSRIQSFAAVEPYLAAEWRFEQVTQLLDLTLLELKRDYEVIIENSRP